MLRKQYCENFGRPAKEPEMIIRTDVSEKAL